MDTVPYSLKNEFFVDGLELMCLEICLTEQKPFLIVYWYRPPNSYNAHFVKFETLLQLLESSSKEFIIFGDLNCDLLQRPMSSQTKTLKCLSEEYDLKQYINKPTRVTCVTETLIDVFYSSNHEKVSFSDVIHSV